MAHLVVAASRIWLRPGVVLEDAEIRCEDGLVAEIGDRVAADDAERLEVDGFVMPAAADRHLHIGLGDPWTVLAGGVTAIRDLGWPAELIFPLAELSEGPSFDGPLVRAAGPILTAPGGFPAGAEWAPAGTAWEVDGPAEATSAVARLAASGAAAIAVSLDAEAGSTPDDATLVAVVEAAGTHDLPVSAYTAGAGQVERALGAGITELAHTPSTPLGDALLAQAAVGLRIVSSLAAGDRDREGRVDNLRRFLAAGGEVVYGSARGHGEVARGIHVRELLLLREAGLDPDAVLAALTRAPLTVGAPADLVALPRDPLEDLRAFEHILAVVKAGSVVMT